MLTFCGKVSETSPKGLQKFSERPPKEKGPLLINISTNAPFLSANATNEAVGINSLTTDPSRWGEGSIYTLSGRKIDGTPARKGMYIRNGRKVVIK